MTQTVGSSTPSQEIKEQRKQNLLTIELPKRIRGSYANSFSIQKITTNYYAITITQPIQQISIFSVKITPFVKADDTKLLNQLFKSIQSQVQRDYGKSVFSGRTMYTLEATVPSQKDYSCSQHSIKIKQVKVVNVEQNKSLLLNFLNNGLRSILRKLGYCELGRSGKYFNSKKKVDIDNMVMYSGYKVNFLKLQKGYYIRVDSAKKIVRKETVMEYIDNIYKTNKGKPKEEVRLILKQKLINCTVMTNYGKTNFHRIIDIKFEQLSSVTFQCRGQSLTLPEYYSKSYNITVNNLKQPILVGESKKNKEQPSYLLPQLMLMTGIPDDFDQQRRKKVSQQTIQSPETKKKDIEQLMKQLKDNEQIKTLQKLGINIKKQLNVMDAKKIDTPSIQLGSRNTIQKGKQAMFNLFNKPIFQTKYDLNIYIVRPDNCDQISQFKDTVTRTAQNINTKVTIKNQITYSRNASVQQIKEHIKNAQKKEANFCLIVLAKHLEDKYSEVKKYACQKQMLTQVVRGITMTKKGLQSIATKVLLQMLAKRGNVLWVPQLKCKNDGIMLIGYDTATCKQGGNVMSICALINSTLSSIYSKAGFYESSNDKFQKMTELFLLAVNAYKERNEKLPKNILIYMNALPNDQVTSLLQNYVDQIRNRLKTVYDQNHNIKITVIMINCKTSERFFCGSGQANNVPAGTLVSTQIVSGDAYDFYLISQYSHKGTSVPNHYRIAYSDSKLQEGVIQEISFNQCFNYVNWTGSIKIPSVLQYAKKCVKFTAEHLGRATVPERMNSKLFFV